MTMARSNGAAATTSYTLRVINRNTWRVYHSEKQKKTQQHLEEYYFHEDAEFNDPHYEMSEAAVCCTPAEKKNAEATPSACC